MKTVDKDTWEVFRVFLDGKDKEIIESAENRKLPVKTFNKFKNKMLEYKGVKYNITQEPNPNGKGLIYQYSINLKEPLKRLNASTFQEAKKKVEKIIDENLHKSK